ncbi:Potassium voltage-gated channel subfamily H member 7 [Phytophthora ramorum]|uniref:Potassium voltage-gated channel subfamily H member 7 n=1 Tax=Phytophthora ramorum TaxID=164328 RepID=UPI0030AB34D8|nr:Potassium voltage-gated channel subfamily H member 7 [Phytophthora ramorum]
MEKSWDLVMLLVAMYHLLVTTFKVSFAADLAYLPASVLRSWSRFETFLDVLCILDVLTKLRRKYFLHHASAATDRHSTLHVNEQAMYADIFAILPFELLLLASDLRVPLAYMPLANGADDASWWTTRWLLRVNRLVFIRRVEPLFEKVLQVVVDKDKMRANEALLYFLQGLATYLTMGHLLACIWVFTSNVGRLFYETSDVVRNTRVLAESTTASYAADISLMHKYLSSLLFAMECISTLFYGDILSMNPVEVATELGITLWSIYIYGALVGAQGELFDSRARREAAFEQTLSQLQRYLVQNEVPKEIKHQVKTYYARLWSCRKGEAEFKAVEQVPRALYEDVVLTTVCSFVVQVKAFEALDDQFLRALLGCLQYVVFSVNEEVFVIGDMDRSMYFIAQGRVSVKVGSSESIRERGDFFGELALLYGMARLETCVALTLSELYRLDHEPYERVLLEFPEYRSRNKLDWTTASQNQSSAVATFKCSSDGVPSLLRMENLAVNIESHVPHSYIYHSALELLSKLNKVDPQEAKDLILQGRDGARRRLNAALGIATSRHNDEVRGFHSRSPSQTSREKEDREKRNNDIEQLEAVVAASLKRSESMRPTKTNSLTLQRRQDDSGLPQLRRWSLAITQTEPYSEFVDPVLDPTAIGQ